MARILVVDDQADLRQVLQAVLTDEGYDIDSADGGRAALQQLAHTTYALVICDLQMPDVDGATVYRAIEQQPPPRPVMVFVSGYADAGPYEEFLRTTQAPVVRKPFDIDVLRETVRQMLSGR